MKTAWNILPDRFADQRHELIANGLRRKGYRVEKVAVGAEPRPQSSDDVLVTWTVHRGLKEQMARRFEAAGGRVIVCEEAYFRRAQGGQKHFALSLHDHNGAGITPMGSGRWAQMGIEVAPWRTPGEHLVVREQRGIGSSEMGSPPGWHQHAATKLRAAGFRVIERAHPKYRQVEEPLDWVLANACAVVTWASSIAGKALVLGVPVIYCAPHSIVEEACRRGLDWVATPMRDDAARDRALERLAWGQWSMAEIHTGTAFDHLLACDR